MIKTRARQGAEIMIGNGWFDIRRLADEMDTNVNIASQTIQAIRNSKSYGFKVKKTGRLINIKVESIKPLPAAPFEKPEFSRRTRMLRAFIFNTPMAAQ